MYSCSSIQPLPSSGLAVSSYAVGHAVQTANSPDPSVGWHTSKGTWASAHLYAQQELNGLGQAPLTALKGVHVDVVDVGEVLLIDLGDLMLVVVLIVVLVKDFVTDLDPIVVFVVVFVGAVAEHLQALEAFYDANVNQRF